MNGGAVGVEIILIFGLWEGEVDLSYLVLLAY